MTIAHAPSRKWPPWVSTISFLEDPLDGDLVPVEPAHHHVGAGRVTGLAQCRDRAEGHWVVGRPQGIDAHVLPGELAHPRFCAFLGPVQVSDVDQLHRTWTQKLADYGDGPPEAADAVIAGRRVDFPAKRKELQRTVLLYPRRLDEDRLGDPVAAALVVGDDAAEPVPILGARPTVLPPLLLIEIVVQQDQRYASRIGQLDDLAADAHVIGGDQVVEAAGVR